MSRGRASRSDTLDLALRALERVPHGDGAQVSISAERSLMLRFARSRPTQATAVEDLTVEVTALRDGHLAGATTNGSDDGALTACARAAAAAAEAAARSGGAGDYPGFPEPAPPRAHEGHDAATARLDAGVGGAALAAAFEVAADRDVEAHGTWTAGEVERAVASSTGIAVQDRATDAFMKVTAMAPGGRSGYAAETAVAAAEISPARIAQRAALKALGTAVPDVDGLAGAPAAAPAQAVKLAPGDYPVVLERHAVAELLSWLGHTAFNGLAVAERRSFLCGRLGTRMVAPCIALSDSPRFPGTLPRAFDAEGVPKVPLPLIQDGVAHRVVHDTRSAALAGGGAGSTGHALAPGGGSSGPAPTNLVLVGGGSADEAELCRPIERGVYVTRLWYVNPVRPAETLMTGVTRDGTFLIEDGEVTRPLEDLRFTDAFIGVLARTQALTARPRLTSDGELYGRRFATGVVCPALRASALRFTA